MILGAIPPKTFRLEENLARRWHSQSEEGAALEKIGASSSSGASGTWAGK